MTDDEKQKIRQAIDHFTADDDQGWRKGMDVLYNLLGRESPDQRLDRLYREGKIRVARIQDIAISNK